MPCLCIGVGSPLSVRICAAMVAGATSPSRGGALLRGTILLALIVTTAATCNSATSGPCVDRVQPNSGSLAGGQFFYIHGSNLLPPSPDPLVPAAVVTIGGTPCDIERVLSSSVRLVCRTRAYTGAPVGQLDGVASSAPRWYDSGCASQQQAVSVLILGVGGNIMAAWNAASRFCLRGNGARFCSFTYAWSATPSITSITPRTASPGDLITVTGKTCVADVRNPMTGARTEDTALKRFERVVIGSHICELSTPTCDISTTAQCPTMYTANLTRPGSRYRPGAWHCEEGTFQCRLPSDVPLGRHNVSFKLPSDHGTSMLTVSAMAPGIGSNETSAALEVIPTVRAVSTHPTNANILVVTVDGLGELSDLASNTSLIIGADRPDLPSIPCPLVASGATDTLWCDRTQAESSWLATTSWPVSCLAILIADPSAESGFYRVKPAGAPTVFRVFCDMDTAGGGWTLCGKFDRDGGETSLQPGFGRSTLNAEAMGTLPFSASQASIDCRAFFGSSEGHVLSVGTDTLSANGFASSTAAVRISGPVASGATTSLFDLSSACAGATLTPYSAHFERLDTPANLGLNRDVWGYSTFGPTVGVSADAFTGSHVAALGCTERLNCAPNIIDSGTAPTSTDVMHGPMGVVLPSNWRRYRSYAVKLHGWFVPPFDAEYRFVVEANNFEKTYLYLSMDHTAADKECAAPAAPDRSRLDPSSRVCV